MFVVTCLLPSKLHLNIRVHQVFVFSYKGLLDVGHDAGVHPGKSLGSVDLQVVTSPLALCRYALRDQQVAGREAANNRQGVVEIQAAVSNSTFISIDSNHPSMSSSSDSLILCGVFIVSPLATTEMSHLT